MIQLIFTWSKTVAFKGRDTFKVSPLFSDLAQTNLSIQRYFYIILFLLFHFSSLSAKPTTDTISVYIFLHEECVISQYYTLPLKELHTQYANDSIQFIGLFPNFSSKKKNIQAFKEKYQIPFSLKTDYFKTKTKLLNATVTPEVVIYNENKKTILYQGRVDNTYFRVGKKRTITTSSELMDALEAIVHHQPIKISKTKAIGCFINRDKFP